MKNPAGHGITLPSKLAASLPAHAVEGARLAFLAELLPHLPDGNATPLGKIDVHLLSAAVRRAIEAYKIIRGHQQRLSSAG